MNNILRTIITSSLVLAALVLSPTSQPTTVASAATQIVSPVFSVTEVQFVWGPPINWSAVPSNARIDLFAYKASPTDMAWVGRCNQWGGEPIVTTANVSICENID